MPSNFTKNYQLSQWERSDKVQMEDFNADNAKIDTAIKTQADAIAAEVTARETAVSAEATVRAAAVKTVASTVPKIVTGTYTGDNTESQLISVGFRPKAVLIMREDGSTRYESSVAFCYGGLILDGYPVKITPNTIGAASTTCAEITATGFRVYSSTGTSSGVYACLNYPYTFHYIAFG